MKASDRNFLKTTYKATQKNSNVLPSIDSNWRKLYFNDVMGFGSYLIRQLLEPYGKMFEQHLGSVRKCFVIHLKCIFCFRYITGITDVRLLEWKLLFDCNRFDTAMFSLMEAKFPFDPVVHFSEAIDKFYSQMYF